MTHTVGMGCSCTNYGHTAYTIHVHAYLSWHCMYVYMCIHIYICTYVMFCSPKGAITHQSWYLLLKQNAWCMARNRAIWFHSCNHSSNKLVDTNGIISIGGYLILDWKRTTWIDVSTYIFWCAVGYMFVADVGLEMRIQFFNVSPFHPISSIGQEVSDIATLELWSLASPWAETRQFARLEAGKVMVP